MREDQKSYRIPNDDLPPYYELVPEDSGPYFGILGLLIGTFVLAVILTVAFSTDNGKMTRTAANPPDIFQPVDPPAKPNLDFRRPMYDR